MAQDQQHNDDLEVSEAELLRRCEVTTYRASGPGGQKRNKTDSAVRLRHRQSGLMVIATESRSQHENRKRAVRRMRERIAAEVRDPVVLEDYRVPDALRGLLPGSGRAKARSAHRRLCAGDQATARPVRGDRLLGGRHRAPSGPDHGRGVQAAARVPLGRQGYQCPASRARSAPPALVELPCAFPNALP